jgi:hypothetical protein
MRLTLLSAAGAVACGALLASGSALAAGEKVLVKSMASELVKARTQVRILHYDDGLAKDCREKSFSGAEIVTMPAAQANGMRKWQEQWVLNRCGTSVGYRVFFTDVGDGGAYFAFQKTD